MAGAGQACVTLGALAALIGVIMGVVFMLSEEFVVANMQCNPDAVGSSSTSAICENGLVTIGGEVCQIGNLGLYTADFTPECLDTTPFAITPLVTRGPSATLEFPPLFPAQTGLAGTAAGVGVALEPFESCEQAFDDPALTTALDFLSVGGAQAAFAVDLPAAIKGAYDAGVDEQFADLTNLLFVGFAQVSVSGLNDAFALVPGVLGGPLPPIPTLTTEAYLGKDNVTDGLESFAATPGVPAALVSQVSAVVNAMKIGEGAGQTNVIQAVNVGFSFGTSNFPNGLAAIPAAGVYAPLNSNVLCFPQGGTCTYIDHIENTQAALSAAGDDSLDGAVTILGTMESVITTLFAGAGLVNRTTLEDDAALLAPLGPNLQSQINIVKGFVDQDEAVPPGDWLTISAVAAGGSTGYPFLCGGVGLAPDCSFQEFINATQDSLANSADPEDQASAGDLALAVNIVNTCLKLLAQGQPTFVQNGTECVQNGLLFPDLASFRLVTATHKDVLASLYSGVDTTNPALLASQAALDAAEKECDFDEQDKAAIAQAQVMFPAGVALSGVGLLVAILNLALFAGSGMSKWIGIFAGVLSLIGLILAVVALFGVYTAPIYSSLGAGEGATPDGEQLFSSGIGFIYVLVSLAGAGVGAVLISLGALFLKVEDPAVDIMKA